jgi:CheY-like chemotaxis protein
MPLGGRVAAELDIDFNDDSSDDAVDWRQRAVIVCDPTPFSRRLTVDILRYAGAERIQTCTTPDSAIWFAENADHSVMLVDWRDDRLDAATTIRKLRRTKSAARRTPAMILSTKNTLLDIEAARDAGADTLALRPVSPRAVTERLTEITQRPRPFVKTLNYNGPDRRVRGETRASAFKRDMDVAAGLTSPLQAARAQAQSIIFNMLRKGDQLSARIGRSLERFLSSVEALGEREREIIQLHRASLGRLADLQGEPEQTRMEVVEGLETLVRRKVSD